MKRKEYMEKTLDLDPIVKIKQERYDQLRYNKIQDIVAETNKKEFL